QQKMQLAQEDLQQATDKLATLEKSLGVDLAEIRIITEQTGGESNLRANLTTLKQRLSTATTARKTKQQLATILQTLKQNPDHILTTPSDLLASQPTLRRLKEGLADAQLRSANIQGRMSSRHPLVIAAKKTEEEIKMNLHREIDVLLPSLATELQLNKTEIDSHNKQINIIKDRMGYIASLRANYHNLSEEVQQKSLAVNQVEQDLLSTRSALAATKETSMLTKVDTPNVGNYPEGPGKLSIILFGMVAGLLTGCGILFLTVVPNNAAHSSNRPVDLFQTGKGEPFPAFTLPKFHPHKTNP
ncbi:MAG: hypothetical protein MPJ24_03460, partial [Pirellulaceae bacterium]|nr:hypothetical protein [Pirellulaceae bacterium]